MVSKRDWRNQTARVAEAKVKVRKRSGGVTVVGLWMVMAVLPWMYRDVVSANYDFEHMFISPMTGALWAFYFLVVVSAIGLLSFKGWAWRVALVLFFMHMLWSMWAIYSLMGPSFANIILWTSEHYNLALPMARKILFVLIITYVIWPIIVILFLLHPSVKEKFSLAQLKISLADVKPG